MKVLTLVGLLLLGFPRASVLSRPSQKCWISQISTFIMFAMNRSNGHGLPVQQFGLRRQLHLRKPPRLLPYSFCHLQQLGHACLCRRLDGFGDLSRRGESRIRFRFVRQSHGLVKPNESLSQRLFLQIPLYLVQLHGLPHGPFRRYYPPRFHSYPEGSDHLVTAILSPTQ